MTNWGFLAAAATKKGRCLRTRPWSSGFRPDLLAHIDHLVQRVLTDVVHERHQLVWRAGM
jgi:hypothetical protein